MEETRPIDQQEEELLDAIARVLILIAKQVVINNENHNDNEYTINTNK